jgi:hypothetical protein
MAISILEATSSSSRARSFFSRMQFTPLMLADTVDTNIILEEGMANSALRKHFQL